MSNTRRSIALALLCLFVVPAFAQSFRVQCPQTTITHPNAAANNSEPGYSAPTYVPVPTSGQSGVAAQTYTTGAVGPANGAIKCQQISGGDGYATMADGTQTYMFSFGPLSGLANIAQGLPGTTFPNEFNTPIASDQLATLSPGYPSGLGNYAAAYNGAVGLVGNDVKYTDTIYDIFEGTNAAAGVTAAATTVTVILNTAAPFKVGDSIVIGQGNGTDLQFPAANPTRHYTGTYTVAAVGVALNQNNPTYALPGSYALQYTSTFTGMPEVSTSPDATASSAPSNDGHVDPRQIMDVGVMNGNIPAPMLAIDEDDEFFLTLTNVGMIMRPDLFEQHTVHFHGYPNASSLYDGVPDASVAINIGGSFTYYYLAPDAGTYFWHCHITPPEHLQMGMVGQLYVRPRQDRWKGNLYAGLQKQQGDLRTACTTSTELLCSNPLPAGGSASTGASNNGSNKYAYNDGDGSTYYDVEYPIQLHGFDPNFHFVGMTFNPEAFADMKDKYFLINGRSYPDTAATSGPMQTQSADGVYHFSQPLNAVVSIPQGGRALLRISDLNVSEYHTLASLGIPMTVIALNAKLLRDQAGNNLYYQTNSITLGGGESLDVILDTCTVARTDPSQTCSAPMPKGTYYLYTPNLDHLSNDAENFGGMMSEVHII